jgi:hypothetical protein
MGLFTAGVAYPLTNAGIGIGTTSPRSALEASVNAGGKLGPVLTLTNPGGGQNAAAAIDFNTYNPPAANYNPSARIKAKDDGNYGNHIVFLNNTPGAANNQLVERMRITSTGTVGIGTTSPLSVVEASVQAGGHTWPGLNLDQHWGRPECCCCHRFQHLQSSSI